MYLRLGAEFLQDGKTHKIQAVIDGVSNGFIIDDVRYTEEDDNVTFVGGSKTDKYFLNIATANSCFVGKRVVNNASDIYLREANVAGLSITDVDGENEWLVPMSCSGSIIDMDGIVYTMNGTGLADRSSTQDGYHKNQIHGYSNHVFYGQTAWTKETHTHTDKVTIGGQLMTNETTATSLFASQSGSLKGVGLIASGEDAIITYYNDTTSESFTISSVFSNRILITYSFTHENGEFELIVDGTTYNETVTIAAFTGDSGQKIEYNGAYSAMFNSQLTKNDVEIRGFYTPAKTNFLDINDMPLTNPRAEFSGIDLNISVIGQSNANCDWSKTEIINDNTYLKPFDNAKSFYLGEYVTTAIGTVNSYGSDRNKFGWELPMFEDLLQHVGSINHLKYAVDGIDSSYWLSTLWTTYINLEVYQTANHPDILFIMQGESNCGSQALADVFLTDWRTMLTQHRNKWPDCKRIFYTISASTTYTNEFRIQVNANMYTLMAEGLVDYIIPTDGAEFTFQDDKHHLDYEGYIAIGRAGSEAIKTLLNPALSVTSNKNAFIRTETSLELIGYGVLSYDEITNHADAWSKLWFNQLSNGIDNITVYESALTGECFNKNVKFYGVEQVYEEDEITPITEEDEITYIIED